MSSRSNGNNGSSGCSWNSRSTSESSGCKSTSISSSKSNRSIRVGVEVVGLVVAELVVVGAVLGVVVR